MLPFNINLSFVFTYLLAFSVQANEFPLAGGTPPYSATIGDTSAFVLPLTNDTNKCISRPEFVQDTILPPCDIIFFKSGKLEYCKIIETAPTTITYKMCDYQDGPNIIVNKSDVHKIRYANGKEEMVVAEKQTVNAYVKPRKDVLATLSFIFGLTSVATVILFGVIVPALVLAGLTLGIISIFKIRRRKGELRGTGTAITGIVLAILLLILIASI